MAQLHRCGGECDLRRALGGDGESFFSPFFCYRLVRLVVVFGDVSKGWGHVVGCLKHGHLKIEGHSLEESSFGSLLKASAFGWTEVDRLKRLWM